jgi:hypothetical protein
LCLFAIGLMQRLNASDVSELLPVLPGQRNFSGRLTAMAIRSIAPMSTPMVSSTSLTSIRVSATTSSSGSTRGKRGRQSGRVERLEPVVSGGQPLRSSRLAKPKCKAKARRLPSSPSIPNVILPFAGAARFATVSAPTLRYYTDFVNFFCQWCRNL